MNERPAVLRVELDPAAHQLRQLPRDREAEAAARGLGARRGGRSARTSCCSAPAGMPGPSFATVRACARPPSTPRSRRAPSSPAGCGRARSRPGCGRSGARARRRRSRAPAARGASSSGCSTAAAARRGTRPASSSASSERSIVSAATASRPASRRERSSRSVASFVSRATCSRVCAEELGARRLVERRVVEQLEEPAEREERRAQLVRGVRDELAAGPVEVREPKPHPLERARAAGRARRSRGRRPARRSCPEAIRSAACSSRRIRRANRLAPP